MRAGIPIFDSARFAEIEGVRYLSFESELYNCDLRLVVDTKRKRFQEMHKTRIPESIRSVIQEKNNIHSLTSATVGLIAAGYKDGDIFPVNTKELVEKNGIEWFLEN